MKFDTSGLDSIAAELDARARVLPNELAMVASSLATELVMRTLSGRAATGEQFASYAPTTQASRAKRGRSTSPVTLSDTGVLLASVVSRVQGDHAIIGLASAELGQRAAWLHQGTRHMPARPWFDLSQAELDGAAAWLAAQISARI